MANIEITLEELVSHTDWVQVFADENAGNVSKETTEIPMGSDISTAPAS